MKIKILAGILIIATIFSNSVFAQEEEKQKTELPILTLERKVDRALLNAVSFIIAGIAYAKIHGETPEDFGKFTVSLWGDTFKKYTSISSYAQKWHRIFQTDENLKMEILRETENSITTRISVYGKDAVDYLSGAGVTLDEYVRFWQEHLEKLTDYLGWYGTTEYDGNWITFTISEKQQERK